MNVRDYRRASGVHLDCDGWSGGESMFSGLCKD